MPNIYMREIDKTLSSDLALFDYTVLIPGKVYDKTKWAASDKEKLYTNVTDFKNDLGTFAYTDSGDLSYLMTKRLLELGLTVLYVKVESSANIDDAFVTRYSDKGRFDIRFITSGGFEDSKASGNKEDDKKYPIADRLNKCALNRGDCIALPIIPADVEKSTTEIITEVNRFTNEEIIREGFTEENVESSLNYSALFVPHFKIEGDENELAVYPAWFGYLCAFASNVENYPDWFAFAGSVRGVTPFNMIPNVDYGDAEIAELCKEAVGFRCVNVLSNIRPYGIIVWGDRTLHEVDADVKNNPVLSASSFLHIRNLCSGLKKTIYRACRRFTFEPNTDVLWTNFTAAITPLLEEMKSNQGISGYKLIKVYTNEKAKLKAIVRIVPIDAVENFYITLELSDSIEIGE